MTSVEMGLWLEGTRRTTVMMETTLVETAAPQTAKLRRTGFVPEVHHSPKMCVTAIVDSVETALFKKESNATWEA